MDLTVCELFAGVGGFRLGFERTSRKWRTVWADQWEPGARRQWAYECYKRHFGDDLFSSTEIRNEDIAAIDKKFLPPFSVLTGGFPCQDYSVARTLKDSRGIEGKKGVLWWQIRDILEAKKPPFALLENVDRLLKSPAKQRGRDFGIMLACLRDLGYGMEWRVVNAADYGAAQRRRRVFAFAWRTDTLFGQMAAKAAERPEQFIAKSGGVGLMARAFPCKKRETALRQINLPGKIGEVSDGFSCEFGNAGFMLGGKISTLDVLPKEPCPKPISSILEHGGFPDLEIEGARLEKFRYLKGSKRIVRKSASDHEYVFSEGAIPFPEPLDSPSRTMLTSEGSLNRSTHVVKDPESGKFRLLTPIEAERLQGFDDGWTEGMPERMRYFCMGNALVVPMVEKMAKVLAAIVAKEPRNEIKAMKTKTARFAFDVALTTVGRIVVEAVTAEEARSALQRDLDNGGEVIARDILRIENNTPHSGVEVVFVNNAADQLEAAYRVANGQLEALD